MIARRGFLLGMLAAANGPAIVRASSLMPIKAPEIIVPATEVIGDVEIVAYGKNVLYAGEIGRYEGLGIVNVPINQAMIRRVVARLKRQYIPPPVMDGRYELMGFAHAEQYADLRGPVLRK